MPVPPHAPHSLGRRLLGGLLLLALTGCEPLTALLNGTSAPEPVTHTVERGDTLWALARRYDVSIDDLRQANDLSRDTLEIGQVLVIPIDAPAVASTTSTAARPTGSRTPRASSGTSGSGGGGTVGSGGSLTMPAERPCLSGPTDVEAEGSVPGMAASAGLERSQVKAAMDAFLGNLSRCAEAEASWPVGTARLEITVACTGRVAAVQVEDGGDLSPALLGCVQQTLRYAPFPAHDMPDGYTFAYPLRFSAP